MSNQSQTTDSSSRLQWYLDAKFGLFIHWGAYTVAGAEASWPIMAPRLSEAMFGTPSVISEEEYIKLPEKFNPSDFDADTWVRTAQDAGMRYIVITAKHHDGFCMFDAPGTEYKITRTPFGRDICLELAQACKRAGMRLGFYYSPPDMNHPGYRDMARPMTQNWLGEPGRKEWAGYLDYMESHIRKLLTDYGEVSVIWFDGLCNHAKYDTQRFHKLIHELSPETLINDRLGDDYDFVTPGQFIPSKGIPVKTGKPPSSNGMESEKFFRTVITLFKIPGIRSWIRRQMHKYAEGTLDLAPVVSEPYPSPDRFQPWETCMTIGQSWAFNPNEAVWKSPDVLVRNLSAVTGHGGNYLLNVGPTGRGVFPPEAMERLAYIGRWMAANAAAIYGSTYTPLNNALWGTATRKDDNIFLHVSDWPANGKLVVDGFPGTAANISLLSGKPLIFVQNGHSLEITLPDHAPDPDVSIITVHIQSPSLELSEYSAAQPTGKDPAIYLRSNARNSAIINGIANGLIAFFSYRLKAGVPALDVAIDIPITVAIITFLTSWLVAGGTRKDIRNGKVALLMDPETSSKHPLNTGLFALLIMIACTAVFGGLLSSLVFLVLPNGFSSWGYILFKTLYTAASGAIAVIATIKCVYRENRIR